MNVWSGRGLCDELITRPEESYQVRVCVCVLSVIVKALAHQRLSCHKERCYMPENLKVANFNIKTKRR